MYRRGATLSPWCGVFEPEPHGPSFGFTQVHVHVHTHHPMMAVYLFALGLLAAALVNGKSVRLKSVEHDPVAAAQGIVARQLGSDSVEKFTFVAIEADLATGHDVFELASNANGTLTVRGNTGVAIASGVYWYLRYYCNSSLTWGVNGTGDNIQLPSPLPQLPEPIRTVSSVRFRYYMNVCTVGYTMAWWDWDRWERELDWMALHGINLPLAFVGQEKIWYDFYADLGLTDAEIQEYLAGPAFLPWQRMGNIRGWAGPLDEYWREERYQLQLKIVARARELGMWNALPGFAGHVPAALQRLYPDSKFSRSRTWAGFNSTYSGDYLLEPNDPVFQELGTKYYSRLVAAFGTDHVYQMDTYNEMEPTSTDLSFLTDANKAVFDAMASVDPEGVYLMQGWLFHEGFWSQTERIQAYLDGVPDDQMIILDLNSGAAPVFTYTNSYFGKPYVWNMLLNYGGRRGLYGDLNLISSRPLSDLHAVNSTMVGIGLTPEAVEHNPVVFELLLEMAWHSSPIDPDTWLEQYVASRYGKATPNVMIAWRALQHGVYNSEAFEPSIVENWPSISDVAGHTHNATSLVVALRAMLAALDAGEVKINGPFAYDLVDIARQVVVNFFDDVHALTRISYQRFQFEKLNTTDRVLAATGLAEQILLDLDDLLATDPNYLLGNWLEAAKALANTTDQVVNREYNARNQITLWGPDGEIRDYASKHWNGVVKDYYLARWRTFHGYVNSSVKAMQPADFDQYGADVFKVETDWTHATQVYPTEASGDTVSQAKHILSKYASNDSPYVVYHDMDGGDDNIGEAWTKDLDQLRILCDLDESCKGFNMNGYLKNTTERVAAAGVTFYAKPGQ
eukprot:TRINITY_DN12325_c0_g1_i12.p1 TRINITY_DN12325_c0_g1~~TRINITY_DN12325_c0_g1_i12.p1  ORF type:complete len:849 (+),score=196.28 TRINITY_DN12325_c0_g1_i12:1113-3659(+)